MRIFKLFGCSAVPRSPSLLVLDLSTSLLLGLLVCSRMFTRRLPVRVCHRKRRQTLPCTWCTSQIRSRHIWIICSLCHRLMMRQSKESAASRRAALPDRRPQCTWESGGRTCLYKPGPVYKAKRCFNKVHAKNFVDEEVCRPRFIRKREIWKRFFWKNIVFAIKMMNKTPAGFPVCACANLGNRIYAADNWRDN